MNSEAASGTARESISRPFPGPRSSSFDCLRQLCIFWDRCRPGNLGRCPGAWRKRPKRPGAPGAQSAPSASNAPS
eukprot:14574802-Alexandrium_andersonii.AAC.1